MIISSSIIHEMILYNNKLIKNAHSAEITHKMEDINQDGNSEMARNRAILGSRSSQIETTAKK